MLMRRIRIWPLRMLTTVLLLTAVLSACGGSEDAAPDTSPTADESVVQAEPAPPPQDVQPLTATLRAEVTMRPDRRLMVAGHTNLPDDAQLVVVIEREASGARWQERAQVRSGQFQAGPLGFGSGVPDGSYSVRVQLSEASVQPLTVRRRIGDEGEWLEGELVRDAPHGLGRIITYTRDFSIGSMPKRSQREIGVRYSQE